MKKILLILAIAASYNFGMAQSFGEIRGTVLDEYGDPMPNAYVSAIAGDKEITTATDFDGVFILKPLPPGQYTVKCSFMGYEEYTLAGIPVTPDDIANVKSLKMHPTSMTITGAPEIVWYQDPLINPNEAMKTIVRSDAIEHSPAAKNLGGLIVSISPGVKEDRDTGELFFRGSRSGGTQYILDGVKIIGSTPRIPSSGIGSISVYTGGVPAKYGDLTGGIVIIETKNYFDLYNEAKYSQN